MFYLVLMKAKVGASWCDLYYTYSRFFFLLLFSRYRFFWNWVGFEKRKEKKNRHTQAFQFLQLVVHMYFVPVKLFILEIKEKKSILEKKNVWPLNVASPWPGLEFGLLVVSSNLIFFFVLLFVSKKMPDFWFYFSHVPHFVKSVSGGVGIL